jgi:phosphoribosylamine--glycine ligase
MKEVLVAAGVPTARFATFHAGQETEAFAFLDTLPGLYVVKTDGLAAGKGVVVTESIADARDAAGAYLSGAAFGDAGRTCVIEEGLTGPEVSLFALCDGRRAQVLATAQDHKRAFDGDTGPNTGGIGAYSPVPFVGTDVVELSRRAVLRAHADARGPEGARVQRPVRGSGVPGTRSAPHERPLRTPVGIGLGWSRDPHRALRHFVRRRRAHRRGLPARAGSQG